MDLNELQKNPEQIQSLINILQSLLDSGKDTNAPQNTQEEKQTNQPDTVNSRSKRDRKFNEVQENKFLLMPEKDMHKDDAALDKVLCKMPPVARAREFTPIKVKCRVCGREESVNPGLVYDLRDNRYKCNRCSTSSG